MQQARGGMGNKKHGQSGWAPRSPRYKFMQTLEANQQKKQTRPPLTCKTVAEAIQKNKT